MLLLIYLPGAQRLTIPHMQYFSAGRCVLHNTFQCSLRITPVLHNSEDFFPSFSLYKHFCLGVSGSNIHNIKEKEKTVASRCNIIKNLVKIKKKSEETVTLVTVPQ